MRIGRVLALITAGVGVPALAGNIIVNPGFETGNLAPTYQQLDFGGPEDWNVTSADAYSGTYSATSVGNKRLRQDFAAPVAVGDITEVSFWCKIPAGDGLMSFDLIYTDASYFIETQAGPAGDLGWFQVDLTQYLALAPGQFLKSVAVWGYTNGGATEDRVFTDDWVVNVVPEPATVVLLALGALVVARRR